MRLKTLKITILPVFCIFVFMIICSIPSVNSLYQLHDFKNIRIGGVFHDAETKNHFLETISNANSRQVDKLSYKELLRSGAVSFGSQSDSSVDSNRESGLLWKDSRLVASDFVAWDLQTNLTRTLNELCHYVLEKNQVLSSIIRPFCMRLKMVRSRNKVNIFVVLTDADEAAQIFRLAGSLSLLDPKYVWIVSERVVRGRQSNYMPEGLVGFRANIPSSQSRITDAVKMIIRAHREESRKGEAFYVVQRSCYSAEQMLHHPKTLAPALLNTSMLGSDGLITFDKTLLPGHRSTYNYSLVNLQKSSGSGQLQWRSMGEFFVQSNASLSLKSIKWIGGSSNAPSSKSLGGSFRLVSVYEQPFIITSPVNHSSLNPTGVNRGHQDLIKLVNDESFSSSVCPEKSQVMCLVHSPEVTAATVYSSKYTTVNCCTGVHVEFILQMIDNIYANDDRRPEFTIHIMENSTYGLYNTKQSKFSGVLGKVSDETFDLVFGPISMTADRTRHFEFSHIYYWSNLVVVTKRRAKTSDPSSILRPFHSYVWLAIAMSVCVVSVSLWIVEKYSPFGGAKVNNSSFSSSGLLPHQETSFEHHTSRLTPLDNNFGNQFDATNSSWYTVGVLLGVSLMSRVPKATSSKLISLIWSLFCLVALTTYTANLAAFMVSETPTLTFPQGFFHDSRVRNPSEEFVISTVCDSFVIEKFRNDEEFQRLAQHLEKKCVKTTEEGFEKVRRSEVNAFLWDSGPSIYSILSDVKEKEQCQLVISEVIASSGGYGIAGARGTPFIQLANMAILSSSLTKYEAAYEKWLPESACEIYERSAVKKPGFLSGYTHQITAEHATGILYVLIAGMILGGVLLPFETHLYERYSAYFRGNRAEAMWDKVLESKRGILMSDGEKNEVLTQKVVRLRGERETLNETIHQLQTQLNSAERENEGLRSKLLHVPQPAVATVHEEDFLFDCEDALLDNTESTKPIQ
ncbi:glutamate receptor ionotropic, NMDA 1-like isoform X2 [Symsagittifera roscoffensis]|uniref:glutamate receptor ionotropic, NMDA 1-like isoform X2 n=1 Tax=Symsagittifera roscoffensis TaxID=84072 RepID=UPI00307B384B